MYATRTTIYPDSGKFGEARELMRERVKAAQSAGDRIGLAELAVGTDGPQLIVTALFNDLAAFEARRKRNQADADFQKFIAKLASLARKPGSVDLVEILLPMPS